MAAPFRRRTRATRKSSPRRADKSSYTSDVQVATLISTGSFDQLAQTDERRLEFFDRQIREMSASRPVHNYIVRNLFRQLDRISHTAKPG